MQHNINEPDDAYPKLSLPGFLNEEDIGFGDIIKRVTSAAGIRPCRGCEQRAQALNARVVLRGRSTHR